MKRYTALLCLLLCASLLAACAGTPTPAAEPAPEPEETFDCRISIELRDDEHFTVENEHFSDSGIYYETTTEVSARYDNLYITVQKESENTIAYLKTIGIDLGR